MKHFYYISLDADRTQYMFEVGSWEIIHLTEDIEELRVFTASGFTDLIIICCMLGRYLFIPSQNFGIMITDLKDIKLNEQLLEWLPNSRNAPAISAALHDYAS